METHASPDRLADALLADEAIVTPAVASRCEPTHTLRSARSVGEHVPAELDEKRVVVALVLILGVVLRTR